MHSIAVVCVRALGAFFALTYLSAFGMLLSGQLLFREFDELELEALAWPAAFIVIGVVLMMWSKTLARLLTAGVPDLQASAFDARQLLQLGTALLGVFFLAAAVPGFASAAGHYLAATYGGGDTIGANADRIRAGSSAFNAAGSAGVGVVLFWMGRGVLARQRAPAAT